MIIEDRSCCWFDLLHIKDYVEQGREIFFCALLNVIFLICYLPLLMTLELMFYVTQSFSSN